MRFFCFKVFVTTKKAPTHFQTNAIDLFLNKYKLILFYGYNNNTAAKFNSSRFF